ncbi:MAG: RnfABCDGE type electron transport complex subunit D, partial [Muribaculaceae bacterium]|nr:RnfABCDGE type electron transport complex subunit D [Muribaculaceae bacterium]
GYNFLNVALVTRAFLFFAYPSKMSGDSVFVSLGDAAPVDGYSGATPLGQLATATPDNIQILGVNGTPVDFMDIFWGMIPGSWGETSTFCILIGAVILLATGMASWKIMLSALVGGIGMACLGHAVGNPTYPVSMIDPLEQLCLGGFMFAIVFMATDPVTSCRTETGKWIYGFLIGVLAMTIRFYNTGYPEGAMLAVLLMNCFAPLIDWCVVNSNIRRRMKRLAV